MIKPQSDKKAAFKVVLTIALPSEKCSEYTESKWVEMESKKKESLKMTVKVFSKVVNLQG